jgi:lipid-A-disaccharide synthase-like uncharacterized protein
MTFPEPILAVATAQASILLEWITYLKLNEPLTYLGLLGNLFWFLRFFHQWIASELKKENVFPIMFWYYSLLGTVFLGLFFVLTGNIPGILAYAPNPIIYTRNLQFALRTRRRLREEERARAGSASPPPPARSQSGH